MKRYTRGEKRKKKENIKRKKKVHNEVKKGKCKKKTEKVNAKKRGNTKKNEQRKRETTWSLSAHYTWATGRPGPARHDTGPARHVS